MGSEKQERIEKGREAGGEIRKYVDRIREIDVRYFSGIKGSLEKVARERQDESLEKLLKETVNYFEAVQRKNVRNPGRTVRGIYQRALSDIESAADSLHALAHYHRTVNIEIRLKPILKGKKTEEQKTRLGSSTTAGIRRKPRCGLGLIPRSAISDTTRS